jgi:hypothetical protein
MPGNETPSGVASQMTLLQMMTGCRISQALYVAAKLGIADLLVDGPRLVEDLAQQIRAHAPTLRRLLRELASIGVFTEARPNAFALSPLAALLRAGTPDSMHALAILYGEEHYRVWGSVLHSVKTGETAFNALFGMSYFEYLCQNPDACRIQPSHDRIHNATRGRCRRGIRLLALQDYRGRRRELRNIACGDPPEQPVSARGLVRSTARGRCRHGASRIGWSRGSLATPICWRRSCIIRMTNAALQSCDIAAGRYQRTGSSW